jgi:hypothetical protein
VTVPAVSVLSVPNVPRLYPPVIAPLTPVALLEYPLKLISVGPFGPAIYKPFALAMLAKANHRNASSDLVKVAMTGLLVHGLNTIDL